MKLETELSQLRDEIAKIMTQPPPKTFGASGTVSFPSEIRTPPSFSGFTPPTPPQLMHASTDSPMRDLPPWDGAAPSSVHLPVPLPLPLPLPYSEALSAPLPPPPPLYLLEELSEEDKLSWLSVDIAALPPPPPETLVFFRFVDGLD